MATDGHAHERSELFRLRETGTVITPSNNNMRATRAPHILTWHKGGGNKEGWSTMPEVAEPSVRAYSFRREGGARIIEHNGDDRRARDQWRGEEVHVLIGSDALPVRHPEVILPEVILRSKIKGALAHLLRSCQMYPNDVRRYSTFRWSCWYLFFPQY